MPVLSVCLCCRQTAQRVRNLEAVVSSIVSTNKLLTERLGTQATSLDTLMSQGTAMTIQLSEQDKEIGNVNARLTEALQRQGAANRHDAGGRQRDQAPPTYAGAMPISTRV